jgi:hypothetical protein
MIARQSSQDENMRKVCAMITTLLEKKNFTEELSSWVFDNDPDNEALFMSQEYFDLSTDLVEFLQEGSR